MNDMIRFQDIVAWDMFACAALTMALHPGTTRDGVKRPTMEEIADIADQLFIERSKRFVYHTDCNDSDDADRTTNQGTSD